MGLRSTVIRSRMVEQVEKVCRLLRLMIKSMHLKAAVPGAKVSSAYLTAAKSGGESFSFVLIQQSG